MGNTKLPTIEKKSTTTMQPNDEYAYMHLITTVGSSFPLPVPTTMLAYCLPLHLPDLCSRPTTHLFRFSTQGSKFCINAQFLQPRRRELARFDIVGAGWRASQRVACGLRRTRSRRSLDAAMNWQQHAERLRRPCVPYAYQQCILLHFGS
jgi:hypothetical protein